MRGVAVWRGLRAAWRAVCVGMAGGLLAGAVAAAPPGLPPELAAAWTASGLPDGALSLVVERADGQRLLAVNPDTPRNPASVMKLVTTFAALDSLGPAHVWRTQMLIDPGTRILPDGTLDGPLYLRAAGDPQFQVQDLWSLLRELRLRGVTAIPELVVDRSIFGPVTIDPGAFDGDPSRPYNASPDAWMVGFGAVRMLFLPDPRARQWRVVLDPPLPGVQVEGVPRWSDLPCGGPPLVSTEPFLTSSGVSLRVAGTVPGGCGEFSLFRLALPQAAHAEAVLRWLWQGLGGRLDGRVREGRVAPDAVLLASHDSPPLAETARRINKLSNNVMARLLLLQLGAAQGGSGATVAGGEQAVHAILAARGLSLPELVVDNGSGLSRHARISADSLARLLAAAWRSPVMPEFVSSLAIAGTDGTVRRRLRQSPASGAAHLKSGSLRDVRALAGYVQGAGGERYWLASMVNHERAQQANAFHDALVAWVATR